MKINTDKLFRGHCFVGSWDRTKEKKALKNGKKKDNEHKNK